MRDSQREVIEFLADPSSYAPKPDLVEYRETHGAIVFLAGDRAYKLKRAVRYPYMDYSTPELRRVMCERELAVNRRTAPDLYLEVCPIVRDSGHLRFGRDNEEQAAIDWIVVMRRFAESDLLAQMLRRGELTLALMRRLAEEIAEFHDKAEIVRARGGASGIAAVINENAALLRKLGGNMADRGKIERLNALSGNAFARVSGLLDRRQDEGRVRRCHGDLHLNNICMIGAQPVLFDAIEFNDDFACIDVLYDLAFPLMDLMHHRLDGCANALLNRYLEKTGDYEGLTALPLFLSCRAAIRAHVAVSRAREMGEHGDTKTAEYQFSALLNLGIACLERHTPRLVAIGGVSGTGKSTLGYTLAPAIAPAPGAVVLRSDILRKRMAGVAETEQLRETAYTDEMHERVYAALAERATLILASGYSVITDAVYGETRHRAAITRVAREASASFTGLWLEAPVTLLEQRIAARAGDASDATIDVLHRQLAHVRAPVDWNRIDASKGSETTLCNASCAVSISRKI